MAFDTTPYSEDLEYFYYTNHPQPIRTIEEFIEVPLYRIRAFADIFSTRNIHRCIGKQGNGLLADQCKVTLSQNILPTAATIPSSILEIGDGWKETENLVKLARSCLCEDCYTTQLSDVVVAWVNELETPVERNVRRADSVVDTEEMGVVSRVVDIAPVKSLVAASVATREVFTKVLSFWS
jgi:hypothetical protein